MQVDFYQLSRDPVEQVLPVIAQRVMHIPARLLVVAEERDVLNQVSSALWSLIPASFLAHDIAGAGNETNQPILLAHDCLASNGAQHVALVDGIWREEALRFDRVFYFFDAITIDAARQSWRALAKRDDVEPRFWRQDGRKWVRGP